jgi:hypothetical protein
MITNKELNEVTLSPTKKDYYQIWNELIDLADKISERWSPAATNESDPGIVLLKVLTAVADKLNYNIDKNTLEAFMPSATQEDSMRKLTEMMGYDMQHYRAATGKVTITYKSSNETPIKNFGMGIYFPKFVNLKNEDEDINYVTLEEFTLQFGQDSRDVAIIEGEVIDCETNNDNIITTVHLDDLNRYILPEYTIAENGIFVTNIKDSKESLPWQKEQNLNIQQPGSKVFKVGFDSAQQLPYIQFPEDIKTLMQDGLRIKYIRTNGLKGNIAAKVLSKLEKPVLWSTADTDLIKNLSASNFTVINNGACTNGADPESLNAAYNNYKKIIGTFDTLVTCRDYMNKIYQMTESDIDTTPLVSNIIVSDIRDDINRSTPVCTFTDYGICYRDMSLTKPLTITLDSGDSYTTTQNKIDHFDLVFYPFKTIYGLNNKIEYKNSFKYTAENLEQIRADLALTKNIAHNIVSPADEDVVCIKNYLKLKARVTTTKKVTLIEEAEILDNIYKAIYTNFNARQLDFGEEIPYETLVEVLKNADYRIKELNLDEPALNTVFSLSNGAEEPLSDAANTSSRGRRLYNQLALRNVLAGKISAFQYDNDFISEYDKTIYTGYEPICPAAGDQIIKLESKFDVGSAYNARDLEKEPLGYVLKENEVIQFRVPNFKTTKTYPAYVNYFIKLNSTSEGQDALPATFVDLETFMTTTRWNSFISQKNLNEDDFVELTGLEIVNSTATFKTQQTKHRVLFKRSESGFEVISAYDEENPTSIYYLPVTDDIFAVFNAWIKTQESLQNAKNGEKPKLLGIYRTTGVQEKPYGRLIDQDLKKYMPAYKFGTVASNKEALQNFYVQDTRPADTTDATADGLGKDASYRGVPKDGEYKLQPNEYLLINYTDSKTDESGTERKTVVNKVYSAGDVIRANFELIDSALYHNSHSYPKTTNFNFAGQQPEGMFTLGTNEQIEIREIVKVELKEAGTYLYWNLNSDDPNKLSNDFSFTENYGGGTNNAYTLKEGEYLYYTNNKKQSLAYYGAGTIIAKSSPDLRVRKYVSSGEVSNEAIMTYGLAAPIPWQPFTLSETNKIEIIENQYVSLTEGDIINLIDGDEPVDATSNADWDWNEWHEIDTPSTTVYRYAEDDSNSYLPTIVVEGCKWSVRSRLDFNMSKTVAQPLHYGDSLTATYKTRGSDDVESTTYTTTDAAKPVYINSNYTCQANIDTLDTTTLLENNLELKLKISSQNAPIISEHEDLLLNNYINGEAKYTKFDFANLPKDHNDENAAFKLNIYIPSAADFGLIAIYYINTAVQEFNTILTESGSDDPQATDTVIKALDTTSSAVNGLVFFNKEESDTLQSELTLNAGLNIIKVRPGVAHLEFHADSIKKSTVIFGNLDIVTGINPKLDYRININDVTSSEEYASLSESEKQKYTEQAKLNLLLQNIRESGIAEDFYYNIPIQRANEIDLNAAIKDDLLSSPLSWYDPNNVNRKFVISEVDADYLSTGITLTKASRA